jgi:hypothetical protein
VIANGSRQIDVTAAQHIFGFVRDFLPNVSQSLITGTLTVEMRPTTGTGQLSALAIQFNGALSPVTITALP